jgi:hypothetical protein
MQISTIKNRNFEKPFRNPSNRTKVNFLKKRYFWISLQKNYVRLCSVTAKMFELRNSGENRRIRSEIFYENLPRAYKELIQVKKNYKLFHACVPLNTISDPDSNGYANPDPESG